MTEVQDIPVSVTYTGKTMPREEVVDYLQQVLTQMSEECNNRNRQQKSGRASEIQTLCRFILEQDTGLEPAAYCLGSSRSTG